MAEKRIFVEGPHAIARFPHVRIGDDVRAQKQLLREKFGIDKLELVVSDSVGSAADLRVSCSVPGEDQAGGPDSRDGEEHPA